MLIPSIALGIGTYTYTAPELVPDETNAILADYGLVIELNAQGNPSSDSYFHATILLRDADNKVIDRQNVVVRWPDIPTARQEELRNLYDLTLQYAINQGLIPAGTSGDDL
jgi:hypothetical protein